MNILKTIFGTKNSRDLKRIQPIVDQILRIEEEYQKKNFTDADFPRMTEEFKKRVAGGESLDHILPEAYALVKNACRHLVGTTEEVCGHTLTWDIVETELVVGAKGDVGLVGTAAGFGVGLVLVDAIYRKAVEHV